MKPKYIIAATFLIASGLIAIGAWSGLVIKQTIQNGLIENYIVQEQTIGQQVAATLESRTQNIQNSLLAIALNPEVQSGNPKTCNTAVEKSFQSLNLGVNNLGRANAQGTFYCSVNKAIIGLPASNIGTYVDDIIADPEHEPVLGRQTQVPGAPGYIAALHVPVYDKTDQFIGTLGGAIYLEVLAKEYLDTVKFAQTGYASLLDDNGDILYARDAALIGKNYFDTAFQGDKNSELTELNRAVRKAQSGEIATARYTTQTGIAKVASVVPAEVAPGHYWLVLVNVPTSEIAYVFTDTGLDDAFNVLFGVYAASVSLIASITVFATVRAAKLRRAEDQFISLVSHQLRTPLTAIRLFSEMLTAEQKGKLNDIQQEYVKNIYVSTERMIRLVSQILNISRISLNRVKVEPHDVNLSDIISRNLKDMKGLAEQHKVTIRAAMPHKPVILNLDLVVIDQILHNLLSNAIRYSKEQGGVVKISLSSNSNGYILKVQDNGIGIPKYARRKVFRQFYRADNAVKVIGEGSGVGLFIAKTLCQASGCKINFVSRLNRGTTFSVTIPKYGMKSRNGGR